MTVICEIAEATGAAESSTAATAAVMVYEAASTLSGVALGFTLGMAASAAGASTADPSSYALLTSTGAAVSTASVAGVLTRTQATQADARSTLTVAMPLALSSTGAAASTVTLEFPPPDLQSTGTADSSVVPSLVFVRTETSTAAGASVLTSYHAEDSSATAAAASSVATALAAVQTSTSTGEATSTALASTVPTVPILESIGASTSAVSARTDWSLTVDAEASSYSAVYFKDPGRVAWVLNTESTAVSWYDNFDFQSIAQVDDDVFAVNSEGVFLLSGADDAGDAIDASVRYGFMDFGTAYTKRFENIYTGYTSTGVMSVLLRVKDSGHAASVYTLEQRSADAPRTSRFQPGKGLYGRYWQVELRNVGGAAFTVYDMDVDLAISNRKL